MEKEVIRISVRNLVEFILRSGDLDTRRGAFADREAMAKGSRIHRKIQKQMGAAYQAEVPLAHSTEFEEFSVLVEGRADGIIYGEDFVMVDEIKGVHRFEISGETGGSASGAGKMLRLFSGERKRTFADPSADDLLSSGYRRNTQI